ncbi:MAG: penicillin-binding protein 2 [Hyphomonadaceae bacterium]|nr:penicillin-binding protein 2 [Hyphomonadaceae bacterium]
MSYVQSLWGSEQKAGARVRIVALTIALLFIAVACKGAVVALQPVAERTGIAGVFSEAPGRADILDRNGELLATSVDVYSLFADPRAIWDPRAVAEGLSTVFEDMDADEVETLTARFSNRERAFVWVRRGLTPRQRQAVFELGLEGLGFRKESRRAYPRGTLAGHVLGYTGIDGNGLAGVEYAMDGRLSSSEAPLRLTIDSGLQFALESELAAAAAAHDVDGGAGVLIDAATGDVLAMASWPPVNPNRAGQLPEDEPARLDRAALAVYELGSVYKPLTVALALDAGLVAPEERFDVSAPLVINGETISDDHPIHGPASVTTVLSQSSNIGTVKISMRSGARRQQAFYETLGLLERAPVEVSGSAAPILPRDWDELSSATASYGHGIAVSPLAFASAFSSLANGGEWVSPGLIYNPRAPRDRRRVMAAPTAAMVTAMMRVAVTDGTGSHADVAGYRVAGKTGTAEKPIAGGYSETENISSFAAIFPAERPQYALLIVLDTPKVSDHSETYGVIAGTAAAWNAAPTAGRVIERIAPLLGVAPRFDAPARSGPAAYSVSETRSTL